MVVFNHILRTHRSHPDLPITLGTLSGPMVSWFLGTRPVGFGRLVWEFLLHRPSGSMEAEEALGFVGGEIVPADQIPPRGTSE